jgi:rare lipoprotein A
MKLRHPSVLAGLLLLTAVPAVAATPPPDAPASEPKAEKLAQLPPVAPRGAIDHSGRKQKGRASFYARPFANRKMADGNRFNPNANIAASRTLPLGTTATVTSLESGRSAVVKVKDRGPHVGGRVLDVTPRVAAQLGIGKRGVVPVVVAPITVPQADGAVKLGAGAAETSPHNVEAAVHDAAVGTR